MSETRVGCPVSRYGGQRPCQNPAPRRGRLPGAIWTFLDLYPELPGIEVLFQNSTSGTAVSLLSAANGTSGRHGGGENGTIPVVSSSVAKRTARVEPAPVDVAPGPILASNQEANPNCAYNS